MKRRACSSCERTQDETRLLKCVVCHEFFCRKCETRRHGKKFCSRTCAEVFFFGDEDE